MELFEVVHCLNRFAPLHLAGSWDNVGLLVEPTGKKVVRSMMLTNDLTEAVLDETLSVGADFILSYHPPIFKPLKKITSTHWKERIVARCLHSGIAIYSPHTTYDAVDGGVNDWLVRAFGKASTSPIEVSTQKPFHAYQIKICSDHSDNLGDVFALLRNKIHDQNFLVDINSSLILCNQKHLPICIGILSSAGRSDLKYVISKNENVPKADHGMGRFAKLQSTQTITDVVQRVKEMTGLSHVRLALATNHDMKTVVKTGAVCAGSGISVLRGSEANLLVTGEMSHHEVLEFTQTGHSVMLLEHSNSERGFLAAVLQPRLQVLFNNKVTVIVSSCDKDPLQFV